MNSYRRRIRRTYEHDGYALFEIVIVIVIEILRFYAWPKTSRP